MSGEPPSAERKVGLVVLGIVLIAAATLVLILRLGGKHTGAEQRAPVAGAPEHPLAPRTGTATPGR